MWRNLSFYRQAVLSTIISAALVFLLVWIRRQRQTDGTNFRLRPQCKPANTHPDQDNSSRHVPSQKASEILISKYKVSTHSDAVSSAHSPKTKQQNIPKRPEPATSSKRADDLTTIVGIGPKTASALYKAGIQTFKDLANLDEQNLINTLKEAGIRTTRTETWPKQASIAAKDGLDKL